MSSTNAKYSLGGVNLVSVTNPDLRTEFIFSLDRKMSKTIADIYSETIIQKWVASETDGGSFTRQELRALGTDKMAVIGLIGSVAPDWDVAIDGLDSEDKSIKKLIEDFHPKRMEPKLCGTIQSSKPIGLNGAWTYTVRLDDDPIGIWETINRVSNLGSGDITHRVPNGTRVSIEEYMPGSYHFNHLDAAPPKEVKEQLDQPPRFTPDDMDKKYPRFKDRQRSKRRWFLTAWWVLGAAVTVTNLVRLALEYWNVYQ